ncbi:hypothetical protein SSBR45G_29950 [Bradyrhizobium sp. SSBR45G]|uniref:aminotransferase class V-fold PLP-dependent enzyme n=1 Tax=unclassified Bradyrhizobium TaxID=2631580 RepID=UPI002342AEBA|nr:MULTISPECIES: aminotransferase class V-fold PLP-dependent enzyme [unclassified Bradyrhizobium]GLH78087.1 hypothetical protein SSBR45G_29950 [Bradyrhizobium sp. SSBR45G]GLH87985.1 hypothetical protein SSBR45R_54450 [Bradyrhizobium sp. SSBR45R]
MFDAIDYSSAPAAETALHALFDPVCEAGILTKDELAHLSGEIDELLEVIRNRNRPVEEYWNAFRAQFGFAQQAGEPFPMNAANLCPEPTALLNAANTLRLQYNDNVAQQTRMARGLRVQQLERAREYIAAGLGVSRPSDVALLRNASEANNAVNCGYRGWRAGQPAENVVLWTENHPTNLAAWELRRRGAPFEIRMVNFQYGESDDQIADAFIRNIDVNTRFVSYSAISNGKGFRIPDGVMMRIWDHAARFDHCHVHVDGTMVWGARPVSLEHEPLCHSFVSSCHKWFLGPKETGILYMHPSKVQNFTPSIFAYDYKIEIPEQLPNTALRFELLGQRDDVNIITLAVTQIIWRELALGVGSYNPYQRVQELSNYLVDSLTRRQPPARPWELLTPASPDRRWGIVRVSAPRGSKPPLEQWLFDNKIVGGGGGGDEFRLCPHIYNTRADIDKVVLGMDTWRDSR